MKLKINRDKLVDNPYRLLRSFGYGFIRDQQGGSESMVKRLGNGFYPRFHMYIKEEGDLVIFDLHLDQQQSTSLSGSRHKSEHQGEWVAKELNDLRNFIDRQKILESDKKTPLKKEKRSWFSRILGRQGDS